MYFSHERTVQWCRDVAEVARHHAAIVERKADLLVLPTFTSIPAVLDGLAGCAEVGAQDVSQHDAGAFTGEVSAAELAELGVVAAEVGHAERRRLFGESDAVVRAKATAALRNGLTPLLCVGEGHKSTVRIAVEECSRQVDDALSDASRTSRGSSLIVAYEPLWAIGAAAPAPTRYIREVCDLLRDHLRNRGHDQSRVIYGGAAGPGLLTEIGDAADGLFLGRFAHDVPALRTVLDEVLSVDRSAKGSGSGVAAAPAARG